MLLCRLFLVLNAQKRVILLILLSFEIRFLARLRRSHLLPLGFNLLREISINFFVRLFPPGLVPDWSARMKPSCLFLIGWGCPRLVGFYFNLRCSTWIEVCCHWFLSHCILPFLIERWRGEGQFIGHNLSNTLGFYSYKPLGIRYETLKLLRDLFLAPRQVSAEILLHHLWNRLIKFSLCQELSVFCILSDSIFNKVRSHNFANLPTLIVSKQTIL